MCLYSSLHTGACRDLADIEKPNMKAMNTAFAPFAKRLDLINKTLKPQCAALG